jgi:ribosomal-protein-alanine N-acetyltransferase
MAQFASAPGTLCLIGSVGDGASSVPGGLLIARKADDEAEILTFGVTRPCRNQGLGRALLQTAVERLRASGAKRLFLEVADGNEAALRLYRSCGAAPVGRRQGYYDHGADAAIFSLAL